MSTSYMARSVTAALAGGVLLTVMSLPSQADRRRSGLDDLSRELSTCSAYYSLLSAVVSNAQGPADKTEVAGRIKETGQAMLLQAIKVANYIGMGDDVVMQRAQAAMDEMVSTINADPPNSLAVMHGKYGQPCDELLQSAPKRFTDLIAGKREDF
jgi:hypothetical protein